MASEQDIASAALRAAARPQSLAGRISKAIVNFVKRKPLGAVGGFIILVMILLAALFPVETGAASWRMFIPDNSGPTTCRGFAARASR